MAGMPKERPDGLPRLHVTFRAKAELTDDEIQKAVQSHTLGEWGDVTEACRNANEANLDRDAGRLVSGHWSKSRLRYYVITDLGRELTTIVFADEVELDDDGLVRWADR